MTKAERQARKALDAAADVLLAKCGCSVCCGANGGRAWAAYEKARNAYTKAVRAAAKEEKRG